MQGVLELSGADVVAGQHHTHEYFFEVTVVEPEARKYSLACYSAADMEVGPACVHGVMNALRTRCVLACVGCAPCLTRWRCGGRAGYSP